MLYHAASAPPSTIGRRLSINELHGLRRGAVSVAIIRDVAARADARVLANSGHTTPHQRRYQVIDRARLRRGGRKASATLPSRSMSSYRARAQIATVSLPLGVLAKPGAALRAEGTEIVRPSGERVIL